MKTFKQFILEGKKDKIDPNSSYNSRTMKQALTSLGWLERPNNSGGHTVFTHPDSPDNLSVPLNHTGDINRMLSKRLIKMALKVKK